jgi:hypothetical protein
MKKIYFFTFIFMTAIFGVNAQIAINKDGSAPHSSAMLDIKASGSTNAKGFLMPRVADHGVITTPAKGLMVFNTTTNSAWMYNGTAWAEMGNGSAGNGSAGNGWISKNDTLYATNKLVGVNTAFPKTTMEVFGNGFLVSQKLVPTSVDPNLSQNNMIDKAYYPAEAGTLYDPSGPSANYPTGAIDIFIALGPAYGSPIPEGYKLSFEDFDTEANGDSLIIYGFSSGPIAKYSGNTIPPDVYLNDVRYGISIQFKTNGNNTVGRGFKMKWQQLFSNNTIKPVGLIAGNNLFYETASGALRVGTAGNFPNATLGTRSVAMGASNRATGDHSFALGQSNIASGSKAFSMGQGNISSGQASFTLGYGNKAMGNYSTALGILSTASSTASFASGNSVRALGEASVSMGTMTTASGDYSIALGYSTNALSTGSFAAGYYNTASGRGCTAMGELTYAQGDNSTAIGNYAYTPGAYATAIGNNLSAYREGSMVLGDSYTGSSLLISPDPNTFAARFRNGYYLYSNASSSVGVFLAGDGNSWSTTSDSTKKENFLPIDGENILKKIANMRAVSWNYKGQDPKLFRHYGPMAQEFYSAFGRDKLGVIGNDTTIASADFDGINFTAIKALEKRTSELQTENENLKKRLALLEKSSSEIMVLKAEMEQLKAFLLPEKEKIKVKEVSDK